MATEERKPLEFILTYHWFEEIKSGQKQIEYRAVTAYWRRRFSNVPVGTPIVFRKGYTSESLPRVLTELRVLQGWDLPYDVWQYFGKPNETYYFEISFKNEEDL